MRKNLPLLLALFAAAPTLANGSTTDDRPSAPAPVARLLLAILLLAFRLPVAAQAPVWQSAQVVAVATTAATTNSSVVTATAVDAAGNVFLAGRFTNTVILGGTTLTSLGGNDVFVAKFNPASSQFVWAQRAGSVDNDFATALAVSGTNVYLAGTFSGFTAGFGATILVNVGNRGTAEVFVTKLADAGNTGNFVWAQQAGSTGNDEANALVVNGTSVYVAGGFTSPTVSFGTITLTNMGFNSSSDVFVAKLTDAGSTGSFSWAQRAGGTGNEAATALAVNGTSVYVAGYFNIFTASFGATALTNAGFADVFVAKLTDAGSTGSFAWAQRAGDTGSEQATALAVNGTSVYIAGHFSSPTVNFGALLLPNTGTSSGSDDVFVAKLTDTGSTGSFIWAQRAGGTGYDGAATLAVNGISVYVAGYFESTTASFGTTALTNAGSADVFVAKLTDAGSTGSFAWAQRAGGTRGESTTALALSSTNVYVVGDFEGPTTTFSAVTLSNLNSGPGIPLGFLASLPDATLTATATGRALAPTQLFPNPAHGTATLRLPIGIAPASLTLTDALGRAVRRYPVPTSPEAALDLRGLPAGLYLLRGAGPAQRLVVE